MMRYLPLFLFVLLLAACSDDLLTDVTAQPSYELNEADCYSLGTLLNGHQTATQKLMLYNRQQGEIALESINLRGGGQSIFRINVDGMAGFSFSNRDLLHIAQGDSLCILLEARFDGKQDEREMLREDFIDIQCNGRLTSIRLTVKTLDVEELRDETIMVDTLWLNGGLDKLIYGDLVVAEGTTLTIDSGVTLYLHDHASIEVYGTLVLRGVLDSPVRLLGDRTDKIFENLYYCDMPSQWGGIRIHPGSVGNRFTYADIRGMTSGIYLSQEECPADGSLEGEQQLNICNSLIQNSDSSLITAHNATMIIENTCLMNSAGALLELAGGVYDITHCTLANYNYWATFRKADVVMRNYDDTEEGRLPRPLYSCSFTNTLIYGNSGFDPNIDADYYAFGDTDGWPGDSIYNYRFDHCLVHSTTGSDDDDCISVLWTEDPLYQLVDLPNYVCDPHLQSDSPCIGAGTSSTLSRLPFDRDGNPRAAIPTIGCYEAN